MSEAGSTTYLPHAPGKIPLPFRVAAAVGSTVLIAVIALLEGADAITDALLAIAAGLFIFMFGYGVNYRIGQRETNQKQQQVAVERSGKWISNKNLERIRFSLIVNSRYPIESDQQILLAFRLSWVYLLRCVGIPVTITALSGWAALRYSSQTFGFNTEGFDLVKHHHSLGVSWRDYFVFFLCFGVACTVIGFYTWSRNFLVVTDYRVIRLRVYPVWLPFMLSNQYSMLYERVENAYIEDSALGGFLGYGGIQIITFFQENEDKYFNLRYVPKHNQVQRRILIARSERRGLVSPQQPPQLPNQFFDPPPQR